MMKLVLTSALNTHHLGRKNGNNWFLLERVSVMIMCGGRQLQQKDEKQKQIKGENSFG